MDAKFQASFIPKQPLSTEARGGGSHVSIFSLVASIIFILTIGIGGAAAIASYTLDKSVKALDEQLTQAKSSFELSTIDSLKKTAKRLSTAKDLISNHIAFSKFFSLLEQSTYQSVAFSDFDYKYGSDGIKIELKGLASSFNALALQSEIFDNINVFSSQSFSDFGLDDAGNIEFKFTASVDKTFPSYTSLFGENK